MKIFKLSILISFIVFLSSCENELQQNEISFNVTCYNNAMEMTDVFKVNDTINFVFTGNPDQITFYSGELGQEYRYKERTEERNYLDTLLFTTKIDTLGAAGLVKLYVSKNMTGYSQSNVADSLAILSANWKDISNRAIWATTTSEVLSGKISLNQEAVTDSTIWLAFRYSAPAKVAQSSWSISNITLNHYASNAIYTILTHATILPSTFPAYVVSDGWGIVDLKPRKDTRAWVPIGGFSGSTTLGQSLTTNASTTKFSVAGTNKYPENATEIDSWIITGPINLSRVLPDIGTPIKSITENATTMSKGFYASLNANFTYKFTQPGTYTVVFDASSGVGNAQVRTVRSLVIEVD